jgi:cell division protein FtsB
MLQIVRMRDADSPVWLLPFGLLVFAIVAVPLHILDHQGLPRYRLLHAELYRVQENNVRIRREVQSLSREVDHLRTDPRAVELIARDELGMVRSGEIVFQFPK